jgi:hypothetical protein
LFYIAPVQGWALNSVLYSTRPQGCKFLEKFMARKQFSDKNYKSLQIGTEKMGHNFLLQELVTKVNFSMLKSA